MTDHTETEFKLRSDRPIEIAAIDAAIREAAVHCRAMDRRRLLDVYFDDAEQSLVRHGLGLRLREDGGHRRLTCKTRGTETNGLFVREEHDAEWSRAEPPRTASDLPPRLRNLVEPFTLDRPLTAMLRLQTNRETRRLEHEGHDLCELAIDTVEASAEGRSTTFFEIEVEVTDDLPANERLVRRLTELLPLHAAGHDKPGHAALRLGLARPPTPGPGLVAETPLPAALRAILLRSLTDLRFAEVGVRFDREAAHLHAMRVAVRRLRTLVRSFRRLWSPDTATWLQQQLRHAGRELGRLRDLDVMVADLPGVAAALPADLQAASAGISVCLQTQRAEARDRLHHWLASGPRLAAEAELERRLLAFAADLAAAQGTVAAAFQARMAKTAAALQRSVAALDKGLPTAPLHALRLLTKRLRYLAEEFAPSASGQQRPLRDLARLQQALGAVCDHEVAAGRLLGFIPAAAARCDDGGMTAASLGALVMQHRAMAKKARKLVGTRLAKIDRKRFWRHLLDASGPDPGRDPG